MEMTIVTINKHYDDLPEIYMQERIPKKRGKVKRKMINQRQKNKKLQNFQYSFLN